MDAKTFYEQIAPELDPGGFKLYFTAQRLTGFDLYGQFPYEDSHGMFEMMNGHQLMRYLLADQFQAIRSPHRHIGHLSKSCTQRYCKTTI